MSLCCGDCIEKCFLISAKCVVENSSTIYLKSNATAIRKSIRTAQLRYLVPLIKDACFEEICNALAASKLPDTDPDYVALSTTWSEFMELATPFLVEAVTYIYWKYNKREGVKQFGSEEEYNRMLLTLKEDIDPPRDALKLWIDKNREKLTCLPAEDCTIPLGVDREILVKDGEAEVKTVKPIWSFDFFSSKTQRRNHRTRPDW